MTVEGVECVSASVENAEHPYLPGLTADAYHRCDSTVARHFSAAAMHPSAQFSFWACSLATCWSIRTRPVSGSLLWMPLQLAPALSRHQVWCSVDAHLDTSLLVVRYSAQFFQFAVIPLIHHHLLLIHSPQNISRWQIVILNFLRTKCSAANYFLTVRAVLTPLGVLGPPGWRGPLSRRFCRKSPSKHWNETTIFVTL